MAKVLRALSYCQNYYTHGRFHNDSSMEWQGYPIITDSPIELYPLLTSNKGSFFYYGTFTIQQLTALYYVLCVYCT